MTRYMNLSGNSGAIDYEIGDDFIWVQFESGGRYRYSYTSAGSESVETMKGLAEGGQGLCTFINKNDPGYDRKE